MTSNSKISQEEAGSYQSEIQPDPQFSPDQIAQFLGQYPPTEEQKAVIAAPWGSQLVVAGAGAGKTETMSARVVWLVANGYILPEQVLGLTFTRKAAHELSVRIRNRLQELAQSDFINHISPERRKVFENIAPLVTTYDSYAGKIIQEYGLLKAIEPTSRIADAVELKIIAEKIIAQNEDNIESSMASSTLADRLIQLDSDIDAHALSIEEVLEETKASIEQGQESMDDLQGTAKGKENVLKKFLQVQQERCELLRLIPLFREELAERTMMTFNRQMSLVAELSDPDLYPQVGEEQRSRFRVIMLDEYQDTSHNQRLLLRHLFGLGQDPQLYVTAVGDPMQSIYGFRGATAANLTNFRYDFPHEGGEPAPRRDLTISWRNPEKVLEVANIVAEWTFADIGKKLVGSLSPNPQRKDRGELHIGWYGTLREEVEYGVDYLHEKYNRYRSGVEQFFDAAILIRNNNDALPFIEELKKRDIPYYQEKNQSLLDIPEIVEMITLMRSLYNPGDNSSLLSILLGQRWNISLADIKALTTELSVLNNKELVSFDAFKEDCELPPDLLLSPLTDEVLHTVHQELDSLQGIRYNLSDVLNSVSQIEGLSTEGKARCQELNEELHFLRRYSMSKPIPEFIADIVAVTGMRQEILRQYYADPEQSYGIEVLDTFIEQVRDVAVDMSLGDFLYYVDKASNTKDVFSAPDRKKKNNAVAIMTVHKAKGLEFDTVIVPFASRDRYFDAFGGNAKSSLRWVSSSEVVPSSLRGDSVERNTEEGNEGLLYPVLSYGDEEIIELRADSGSKTFADSIEDYILAQMQHEARESDRLFYVAVTRSKNDLLITGHAYKKDYSSEPASGRAEHYNWTAPSAILYRLKEKVDGSDIRSWAQVGLVPDSAIKKARSYSDSNSHFLLLAQILEQGMGTNENKEQGIVEEERIKTEHQEYYDQQMRVARNESALFPPENDPELIAAAEEYKSHIRSDISSEIPSDVSAELEIDQEIPSRIQSWNQETQWVIEETLRKEKSDILVEIPLRLTASEIVQLSNNREEFARRRRRPIPFEPQSYAKRGTAFHNWVEEYYGGFSLLDESDLPGAADEGMTDARLEELKEKFQKSVWAQRTPISVEGSYSVNIAGRILEGRIDAIFREPEGSSALYHVVDWKTGRKPHPSKLKDVEMQLAVYRLAWAKLMRISPEQVRASFHYISTNETYEPERLFSEEELVTLVEGTQE